MQGLATKHSACLNDYVVGGPLSISTSYQAGVEYDCFFLAALSRTSRRSYENGSTLFAFNKLLTLKGPSIIVALFVHMYLAYYRPEWTCGRYNQSKHIALMYNLLEGVVHFFEDISADFISIILSTPKNSQVDYNILISSFEIKREDIDVFLSQLVDVGLLSNIVPDTDSIQNLRTIICSRRHETPSRMGSIHDLKDVPLELSTAEMSYAHALKDERVVTSAMFELTYRCSEKCIHCYNIGATRNDEEYSGRHLLFELNISDYKRVIDELYEQGLVKVCLTGGDPFSKREIWDIIEYLYSKDIAFDIFTNGQLLIGNEARLARYYPRLVGVSIYSGDPIIHDSITRVPGSFEKSIAIMDNLCRLAVPLNLKCCVMRHNVKTYRSVLSLAKKYNATPQIEVNLTDSVSGDKCVSHYLRLNEKEFNIVLRDIEVPLYVGPESKYFNGAERKLTDKACGAGENTICITPDGDVIPCCTFHFSFGNIQRKKMKEILSSNEREWWLSRTLEHYEECARHDYCSFCNLCPGVNFSEHETPLKAGSNNCHLAKIRWNLAKNIKEMKDPIANCSIDKALECLPEPIIGNIRRVK